MALPITLIAQICPSNCGLPPWPTSAFSIQQKFNNIGKAMKPGATSKIERISTFLKAPVALVIRNPADRAWLARLK